MPQPRTAPHPARLRSWGGSVRALKRRFVVVGSRWRVVTPAAGVEDVEVLGVRAVRGRILTIGRNGAQDQSRIPVLKCPRIEPHALQPARSVDRKSTRL